MENRVALAHGGQTQCDGSQLRSTYFFQEHYQDEGPIDVKISYF